MSGFVEGYLNGVVFVDPAKIGPEILKIDGLSFDSMFVLGNVGDIRGMSNGVVNSPFKIAKFHQPWGHVHHNWRDLEPRCGHQLW